MSTNRDVSNLSYTNKDFNSIYVELLEYAKKLSYRWDPSVSDESDPGVILLKLAALIGDKNNYNIDKNILELMPNSVTQLGCARQLFSQCGYTMAYYNSAVGQVNVTIERPLDEEETIEDAEKYTYVVPRFTMFTDINNSIVYTTTEQKILTFDTQTAINVMEGTVSDYTINNDKLITTANLDSNNRIYFTETDIAENGIFITNVKSANESYTNYEDWQKVDVLETQPPMTLCYKFGLSLDGNLCYIQFPDDIDLLFGEGVNIKYIRTKGSDGNIAAGILKQFYVDTNFIKKPIISSASSEDEEVAVTTDSVTIHNPLAIVSGCDPETINEAYRSYRRVKTTFDTLVSLKDYTDYMVTSESASNGYVCDRTNDIQRSYKIRQKQSAGSLLNTVIEEGVKEAIAEDGSSVKIKTPAMTAFDLCVYALEYIPTPQSLETFERSFKLTEDKVYETTLQNGTQKSLQHDFLGFESERILLVKNKYPILCTIVPRYELTATEKFEIQQNIETALCEALNSNHVGFGESIMFDTLKNTIINCDDRIKHIEGLATPTYSTWVTYKTTDGELKEMRVDHNSFSGGYEQVSIKKQTEFDELVQQQELFYIEPSTNKMTTTSSYKKDRVYYSWNLRRHELWLEFRAEIYAKNILSGATPLYRPDSVFSYGLSQINTVEHNFVEKLTTNTNIVLKQRNDTTSNNVYVCETPLLTNESILLTAPNFIEENNFSTYVKVLYNIEGTESISANSKYTLKQGEFIVFFWKASDSDSAYTYIKYDGSSDKSLAKVISPSFDMSCPQTGTGIPEALNWASTLPVGKGSVSAQYIGEILANDFIKEYLTHSNQVQVLTGGMSIKTMKINKIHINNKKNGSSDVYWILNNKIKVKNQEYYRLFDEGKYSYTLKSGEYFIYTNTSKTTLYMLGEGTIIDRSASWDNVRSVWDAPVIDYSELLIDGLTTLDRNNCWQTIGLSDTDTLYATETQHHLIGPENSLYIVANNSSDLTNLGEHYSAENNSIVLNNSPVDLKGFKIGYEDSESVTHTIEDIDGVDFGWTAVSILNVDVAPDKPQELKSHQSFTLIKTDNEGIDVVNGDPKYVLCNMELNIIGGVDLPVMQNEEPAQFISYDSAEDSEDVYYNNEDFTAVINLHNTDAVSTPIRLTKGSYLLQLTVGVEGVNVNVDVDGLDKNNFGPVIGTSNEFDTCFKIIVNDAVKDFNLIFQCDDLKNNSTVDVHVKPLFKYNAEELEKINTSSQKSDIVETPFEDQLVAMLDKLDPKRKFDYTSTELHVDNPLLASSFLNSKHFYNQFTICQWSVEKSLTEDIVVLQEIR